jgi:AraC-like DNA-binding protein
MAIAARVPDGALVARLAGYADHAHLCRDFRAVTGVTMSEWRHHVPGQPAHVPVR